MSSLLSTLRSPCWWGKSIEETSALSRWSSAPCWKPAMLEPRRHQGATSSSCQQLWRREKKNAGTNLCDIWTFSAFICALLLLSPHPFPSDCCWHRWTMYLVFCVFKISKIRDCFCPSSPGIFYQQCCPSNSIFQTKKNYWFFLKIAARERTNMYINCNLVSPSFRSSMLSSVLSFWWGCSSLGKTRDWHAADAGSIARCGKGFSPRVNFQCRLSYGVRTTRCAIACINICVRVKDPAVHVRVRWIMKTLKHPVCIVGWVARLCRS